MSSTHTNAPDTLEKLERLYPKSDVRLDVSVDTGIVADFTVSQKVGRDLAFKRVEEITEAKPVIRELLQCQIGGYSPILITPFNTEKFIDDNGAESEIAKVCSDAGIGILGTGGDKVDYVLHPQ